MSESREGFLAQDKGQDTGCCDRGNGRVTSGSSGILLSV